MCTLATAVIRCGEEGSDESIGFKRQMEIKLPEFKIGGQYVIEIAPHHPATVHAFNCIAPGQDSNHPNGVYFFRSIDSQVFDSLIEHSGGKDGDWEPA